jgi:hypothetical protein
LVKFLPLLKKKFFSISFKKKINILIDKKYEKTNAIKILKKQIEKKVFYD